MKRISHFLFKFFVVISVVCSAQKAFAQEISLSDSAFISLLTVTPGEEVYAQYGHTAIRVSDSVKRFDLVFNYGLFDFNSPNFIYRFVKGETDYLCGASSYSDFIIEYQMSNREVSEQVLNLNNAEKERIWQALVKNIQPENSQYRYNFFYNNCSTKPRDVIVSNLDGKLLYKTKGPFNTLRDEIHHFTAFYPWTQFGIDFVIGADADKKASLSDNQFAPTVLAESFNQAYIVNDSIASRFLVAETRQAVSIDPSTIDPPKKGITPIHVGWLLFALIAVLTVWEFRRKRHLEAVTAIVYGIFGLTGSIIAFMVFFSVHPATHQNFLLLWQNPFHLLFAIGMIFGAFRRVIELPYLAINLILQIIALAGLFFLPQHLNPAFIPLLLIVLMRTILGTQQQLQKKKKNE